MKGRQDKTKLVADLTTNVISVVIPGKLVVDHTTQVRIRVYIIERDIISRNMDGPFFT